jgi:hypothetical protein
MAAMANPAGESSDEVLRLDFDRRLAWLSEQNVSLIRIDWQGNVQSVLASNWYAANPYRVAA